MSSLTPSPEPCEECLRRPQYVAKDGSRYRSCGPCLLDLLRQLDRRRRAAERLEIIGGLPADPIMQLRTLVAA